MPLKLQKSIECALNPLIFKGFGLSRFDVQAIGNNVLCIVVDLELLAIFPVSAAL